MGFGVRFWDVGIYIVGFTFTVLGFQATSFRFTYCDFCWMMDGQVLETEASGVRVMDMGGSCSWF